MLVGGLPDLPADVTASGEEDVVKLLLEQLHSLLDPALDNVEGLLVKVAGEETRHDVRGGSGNLRGFDDGTVTSGYGSSCGKYTVTNILIKSAIDTQNIISSPCQFPFQLESK